ncbi:CPK7 [Symbiodinium sp. CCMP2592]|nr:CPK7 [Symbiodinium sp. CCMP2592]
MGEGSTSFTARFRTRRATDAEEFRSSFARSSFIGTTATSGSVTDLLKCCGSGTAQQNYMWNPTKDVLGQGVTGIVFKARPRHSPDRCCVIKQQRRNDMALKAILAEFQHTSALCHPNILQVREYFVDILNVYVIAEWAEGGELSRVISHARGEGRPPSVRWVASVAQQLLRALRHCHVKHRLVHADIKPENVLLFGQGALFEDEEWIPPAVLLADFGNAAQKTDPTGETIFIPMGDPRYAAPELHQEQCFIEPYPQLQLPLDYLHATDIWMLGATLHEMLFLRLPYLQDFRGSHQDFLQKMCNYGQDDPYEKFAEAGQSLPIGAEERARAPKAVDLLEQLLGLSYQTRITADAALASSWLAAPERQAMTLKPERAEVMLKNARSSGRKMLFTTLEVLARHSSFAQEERDLMESFCSLDVNGHGEVPIEDLQVGLRQAVPTWSNRELNQVVAWMTKGFQDKVVDFRRFVACSLDLEDDIVAERLRILFHRFPRRGIQIRVVWPETSALTKMFGQALPGGQSLSAAAMTLKDRLCQALQQQLNCAPKFVGSEPSKKRSKRKAEMFFEIEPESWDRGNGDGLQSNLLSKSKAIGMQKVRSAMASLAQKTDAIQQALNKRQPPEEHVKIHIDPDNFILSDDMTGMLKITEGHGNQLMFKCPLGHSVRGGQAPLAGSSLVQRYQHCNVCLEGLQEKESLDVGDPTHCLMCGYAVCAQCLAKRTWLNSLFPAGGRTWMRLYMEGLESQGSFLCLERFKLLWLGQVFRHHRTFSKPQMMVLAVRHLSEKCANTCPCLRKCLQRLVRRCLGESAEERQRLVSSTGGGAVELTDMEGRSLSDAAGSRAPGSERKKAKKKTKLPGIKLVIFDFDLTLAAVHVFHNLTGGAEGQAGNKGTGESFGT